MRGVEKYLIQWKGFIAEGDTWKRRENLKNVEELIEEFEKGGVEVRRQEKVEKKKELDEYRRMELPGKYTVKLLYGWDDKEFEEEYLKKLEKNWRRWKNNRREVERVEEEWEKDEQVEQIIWGGRNCSFSRKETLKGG